MFSSIVPSHSPEVMSGVPLPPRAVVLAGTPGSGRTSLLNHLLQSAQDPSSPGSTVVIENDYRIDGERINAPQETILPITAGCICCNDLHSLRAAVSRLQSDPKVRTIFYETTGISQPAVVKELLHKFNIPTLLIVTVDTRHFDENERLGRNAQTIPFADILALTWTHSDDGQRDDELVTRVSKAIGRLNPNAPRVEILPTGEPLTPLSLENHQPIRRTSRRTGLFLSLQPSDLSSAALQTKREFTATFDLIPDASPDQLVCAIKDAGLTEQLLRARGHINGFDIEFAMNDWRITETAYPERRNYITLTASAPLSATSLERVILPLSFNGHTIDLSDPKVRESAEDLVKELLGKIPQNVVNEGQLITETDAGEAWRYVSLPGFSSELKEQFLESLCTFYLRQHEALSNGQFDSHQVLPYYQREVGYNLSWFLIDCHDLLCKWGLNERIRSLNPVSLYFSGLAQATDPIHIGSFKKDDEPYLKTRLQMIELEAGSSGIALAERAISNCQKRCLDRSWDIAASVLESYLRAK